MELIYKNKIIKEILMLDTYYATGEEDLHDSEMVELSAVLATIDDALTVDALPKSAYDLIKKERDIAISQLESYGVQFGEKADVQAVRHGKWELETWAFHGSRYESVYCSECKNMADGETPYCPYCGAKMDAGDGDK